MRKPLEIDLERLAALYTDEATISSLARVFGVSRYVVEDRLIRLGLRPGISRHLAHQQHDGPPTSPAALAAMYGSGMSTYAIAAETGIPRSSARKLLIRQGVRMRTRRKALTKYAADHRFFAYCTSEACYWAGMLAADGCIIKPHSSQAARKVLLGLKTADREHVAAFKEALRFTGRIYEYEACASLVVTSDPMADDLDRNFRITARKSLTLRPPSVPPNMRRHFIRGYVDGDGCLVATRPQISIVGTQAMLEWILACVRDGIGQEIKNPSVCRRKQSKCFCLTFGGRHQTAALAEWLYGGTGCALDRKRQEAERYMVSAKYG